MKINLIDPALVNLAGHHYDINLRVTKALVAAGHEVQVYAGANVNSEVREGFSNVAQVRPIFRINPYRITPMIIDPVAGEYIAYNQMSVLYAQDLARMDSADRWFWPTMFASQLNGCALA